MNKVVTRNVQLRAASPEMVEKRQAEFVISTETVDSYGTVFRINGWELDNYLKNPIVTYNHSLHSRNPDDIIGVSQVFIEDNQLIGRVTFETEDVNPLAEKVWRKIQAGTLKMASIGALPKRGDWGNKDKGEDPNVLYFSNQELIEWSVVPAGANKDAHKRNTEAVDQFRQELAKKMPVEQPEVVCNNKSKSVFEAQIIINQNKLK